MNLILSSAATVAEIEGSGVAVASLFFGNVFGAHGEKALTVFIALRYVFDTAVRHADYGTFYQCTRVSCCSKVEDRSEH